MQRTRPLITKYSFFKTNVEYQREGSFAVQDETTNTITVTLLKILEWSKYWKQLCLWLVIAMKKYMPFKMSFLVRCIFSKLSSF